MRNKRYPISLFLIGCIINFFKNCLLNVIMLLMLFAGIWIRPCLYIGIALLVINLILSFIIQIKLKRTLMRDFENSEDHVRFKDIILDANWVHNAKTYTEEKINDESTLLDYKDYTISDDTDKKD